MEILKTCILILTRFGCEDCSRLIRSHSGSSLVFRLDKLLRGGRCLLDMDVTLEECIMRLHSALESPGVQVEGVVKQRTDADGPLTLIAFALRARRPRAVRRAERSSLRRGGSSRAVPRVLLHRSPSRLLRYRLRRASVNRKQRRIICAAALTVGGRFCRGSGSRPT